MEYTAYCTRWLLLAIGSASVFIRTYVSKGFASINNVISSYFQVDPSAVDLLAIGDTISASFFSICIALVGNRLGLRTLFLVQGITMFFGTTLSTIGFISRELYWVVATGRVLMGIQQSIIYILPTLLAAHWFKDREVASVFSIQLCAMCVGGIACGLIFPNILPYAGAIEINPINVTSQPYVTTMTSKTINSNVTLYPSFTDDAIALTTKHATPANDTFTNMDYAFQRNRLIICFGLSPFIMFFTAILTVVYCKDHPPTPPSAAQDKILKTTKSSKQSCPQTSCDNFKEILNLARNRTFVLLCWIQFLNASLQLTTFLSSFVLQSFPNLSNRTPGVMFTITNLMAGIGCLLGGKLCDRFKSFKIILLINQFGIILCCILLYLGHLLRNLPALFVAYPLGYCLYACYFSSLNEFVVESTYPVNKIISTCVFYSFYNLGVYVSTFVIRRVQELCDETWAVFLLIPINCTAFVLLILTKPNYRRTEVEKQARKQLKSESEALTSRNTEV